MALLKTANPDDADGKVGEIYRNFKEQTGMIPAPLRMMTASPRLFESYVGGMGYWRSHPTLNITLLACVRYLVASQRGFQACIEFNGGLLCAQGMTETELEELRRDPKTAPLADRERELLSFVVQAIADPSSATRQSVDALHDLGWTDVDIYDATYHGSVMTFLGLVLDIFGPLDDPGE